MITGIPLDYSGRMRVCPCLGKARRGKPAVTAVGRYVERHAPAVSQRLADILKAGAKRIARTVKRLGKTDDDEIRRILAGLDIESLTADMREALYTALLAAYRRAGTVGVMQAGFPMTPDIVKQMDEKARAFAEERGGWLIKNLAGTTIEALRATLARGIEQGMSAEELSDAVEASGNFGEARADMIARTELAFAHVTGNVEGWRQTGEVDRKQAVLGDLHDIDDECLLAGTLVRAVAPSRGIKRDYVGPIIDMTMNDGQKLSGTPNHPIFTDRGWVALRDVHEGTNVLTYAGIKGIAPVADYFEQAETRIEDVVASLRGTSSAKVTKPTDFHGDGIGSKVHTVTTDLLLRHEAQGLDEREKHQFAVGLAAPALLSRFRNSCVRVLKSLAYRLGAYAFRPFRFAFTCGSSLESVRAQAAKNTGRIEAGALADLSRGEVLLAIKSGQLFNGTLGASLAWEAVRSVRLSHGRCEVFNLTTEAGFFLAGGIVTRNCDDAVDAGVIDIDEEFIPGYAFPPFHPNCICDVLPVLKEEAEA